MKAVHDHDGQIDNTAPQREDDIMKKETEETVPATEPASGKPRSKDMDWIRFSDSTSISEIQLFVSENRERQFGAPELRKEASELNEDKFPANVKTDVQELEHAKSVIVRYYKQLNKVENAMGATFVDLCITLGLSLKKAKKIAKKCKVKWEDWVNDNLPVMKTMRTIEKYMRLATRKDAWAFKFLALERLDKLITATQEEFADGEEDPIGEFLKEFGINYDPTAESSLQDFIDAVDGGIMVRRLAKKGVTVPFPLMKEFAENGGTLAKWMIDDVEEMEDDAKVAEYFQEMIDNESFSRKLTKAQSVNTMFQRIAKRLGVIVEKEHDVARGIDLEEITKLEAQIALLKGLRSSS